MAGPRAPGSLYIYIYIASGNPIQPAPAQGFKHPGPAQAGRVASPTGLAEAAYLAGGGGRGDATGPEGENMSGTVG